MATITEVGVRVALTIRRDGAGIEVMAKAVSVDANGQIIRRMEKDIFPLLSAARQAGIADLLTDAENKAKTQWEIA